MLKNNNDISGRGVGSFDEQEASFRKKILSNLALWLGTLILITTVVRNIISPFNFIVPTIFGFSLFLIPVLLRKNINVKVCGCLFLFSLFVISMNAGINFGGMRAPAIVLFILMPMIGYLILSHFGAKLAMGLSLLGIISLVIGEALSLISPQIVNPEKFAYYKAAVYFFAVIGSFVIGYLYEKLRKEKENIANELSAHLAQASKMSSLGEMASGIAHEINNPLAIISGKASSLKRKIDTHAISHTEIIKDLETISNTIKRISKIISGLKSFSRNSDIDPMERSLVLTIIDDTLALCDDRLQRDSIQIFLEIDPKLEILCRASQISQVILNLIINSCDAILDLKDKWIKIEAQKKDSSCLITVTDSGRGIPKDIALKMNQPFFTTKPVGQGTGLGLIISYGIIQSHGGSLEYNDQADHTQFVIRVPIA